MRFLWRHVARRPSLLGILTLGIVATPWGVWAFLPPGQAFKMPPNYASRVRFRHESRAWMQAHPQIGGEGDVGVGRTNGEERGSSVHPESWFLGDGGFAQRHLEDEQRNAEKKDQRDFFKGRSLSITDQMREASMLLLAQQKMMAAQEAREVATEPRFVAAAGGSARAQREKTFKATAQRTPHPVTPAAGTGKRPLLTKPGSLSGKNLGVGGLDEELEEIRRRVCVPLAAPSSLLHDLGISPVRGLLLHGPPGCGKTLLARRLSTALTPRPPTVVSGPEILERFVGSSEANIRALFDYPPDVEGEEDPDLYQGGGALHVIVLDEFDSIGQRRGGGDDGGDRVRDSVVNQLLARMDGFQELEQPTLLVALTNRIDLLDPALLRPGRFEVQLRIGGPDRGGREDILRIHTKRMYEASRLALPTPEGGEGDSREGSDGSSVRDSLSPYDELMSSLAGVTPGFTGAELAGVVRAAASYALERAVAGSDVEGSGECLVDAEDFGRGLADVMRSRPDAGTGVSSGLLGADVAQGSAVTPATVARVEGNDVTEVGVGASARVGGGEKVEMPTVKSGAPLKGMAAAGAAAVVAARGEWKEENLGRQLSVEDLEAVQKLLLHTNQEKGGVEALAEATRAVSKRRGLQGGDSEKGERREDGGEGKSVEGDGVDRKPKLRKFKHTGWFHTYE